MPTALSILICQLPNTLLEHGLSLGKTSSSDLRSPFSELNLICTPTKVMVLILFDKNNKVLGLIH